MAPKSARGPRTRARTISATGGGAGGPGRRVNAAVRQRVVLPRHSSLRTGGPSGAPLVSVDVRCCMRACLGCTGTAMELGGVGA